MNIGGKAVTFTEKMPARVWWDLYPRLSDVEKGDRLMDRLGWDVSVDLCRAVVESWEFDGDPHDAASYEELDFMTMLELVRQAFAHAIQRLNRGGAGGLGE